MRYIDADKLIEFIEKRGAGLGVTVANCCNFKDIVKMIPTEDVVQRAELKEIVKFKDMAYVELSSLYIETTQEVAKGTVEIIQAHLNMLFEALRNEKTDATVEKLIEINSKIAILESIQLALGDVIKKYIGE